MFANNASAVTVSPGVYFRQGNGDAIYGFSNTMQFNIITITADNVTFNATTFNTSCIAGTEVNVTFNEFINNQIYNFTHNRTGSRTWFNLSGLPPNIFFTVYHNSTKFDTLQSDSSGNLNFNSSDSWNGTILLTLSTTLVRITAKRSIIDIFTITEVVITVVGILITLSIILIIIYIMKRYQ